MKHDVGADPGEHEFLQSRGMDPVITARQSLDRLRDTPARIVIGRDYRGYDLVARCFPNLAGRLLTAGRSAIRAHTQAREEDDRGYR